MGYFFVLWTIELCCVCDTLAYICDGYSTATTNNVKVKSNHAETGTISGTMKSTCIESCMPNLHTVDCAISYIADDAGSPDGPGDCFYYDGNCGGGCSTDSTSPGVVMVFHCTALNCGQPTQPTNGAVDTSGGTMSGDTATYLCNLGYVLSGSSTTTCDANGVWNNPVPNCIFVDCGPLSDPTNGAVTSASTLYGFQADYSCNFGYALNGASSTICGANGNWDAMQPTCVLIDCGSPGTAPTNGHVSTPSGTLLLHEAVYTCDIGYSLIGISPRVCQSGGLWDSSIPSCDPVDCGTLLASNDGSVSQPSGTTYGMVAIYSCNPGYIIQGPSTRTCLVSGVWDGSEPTCTDIRTTHCQAYGQAPSSTVTMVRSGPVVLPRLSLLQISTALTKTTCARMCADLLRNACEEPTACIMVKYYSNSKLCELYHSDSHGYNVTCDSTNICYTHQYYIYFI